MVDLDLNIQSGLYIVCGLWCVDSTDALGWGRKGVGMKKEVYVLLWAKYLEN